MAKIKDIVFETMSNSYCVIGVLGEGGCGRVFRVLDEEGNEFAIKQLSPSAVTNERLKRFRNELVFLSRHTHKNLVPVIDSGFRLEDGIKTPFYVMPVYESTLKKYSQEVNPDRVLQVFADILDGVEALHLNGVWHRDLKPENILFDAKQKCLVVADLGIAHFSQEELHTAVETKAGDKLANYLYAAPEQKKKGATVDARADIFALGLILNELFTGEVLHGAGHKTIASVVEQYAFLDDLVTRMVQQTPDNRFGSIADIKRELQTRAQTSIQLQKISQLEQRVVPESEIDDPLVINPPRPISADYDGHLLEFTLDQPVNHGWIGQFKQQSWSTALLGKSPREFGVVGDRARIPAAEHEIERITNDFKRWVRTANEKYAASVERQQRENEQKEKEAIAAKLASERKRLEVQQNILSKLSFD